MLAKKPIFSLELKPEERTCLITYIDNSVEEKTFNSYKEYLEYTRSLLDSSDGTIFIFGESTYNFQARKIASYAVLDKFKKTDFTKFSHITDNDKFLTIGLYCDKNTVSEKTFKFGYLPAFKEALTFYEDWENTLPKKFSMEVWPGLHVDLTKVIAITFDYSELCLKYFLVGASGPSTVYFDSAPALKTAENIYKQNIRANKGNV